MPQKSECYDSLKKIDIWLPSPASHLVFVKTNAIIDHIDAYKKAASPMRDNAIDETTHRARPL